ncbi:MAG: iron ABC transporter permease [Myxococcota bacterium]|nr:iron ABC transporter permease [Myxococcota bacterium]
MAERYTSPLRRAVIATLLAAGALAVTLTAGVSLGSSRIDLWAALVGEDETARQILVHARLPRVALAVLTGGALSLAGVTFQALLRNPLATPYTLGISSGASFGAVLAIVGGQALGLAAMPTGSVPLMAFVGAGAAVGISYLIARRRGPSLPTSTLLLGGVCIAFFFGAMTLFVHYIADLGQSYLMMRWLMGSLDVGDLGAMAPVVPMVVGGTAILFAIARHLNLLAGGEAVALSRGVDVRRIQQLAYFAASLITAAVVGVAGPIGFVGLVVPHTVRLLVGPDHRVLMPTAILAGAAFLVLCDLAGRTLIAPTEIPVGVITAMTGGPFLVWLLRRHTRGESW